MAKVSNHVSGFVAEPKQIGAHMNRSRGPHAPHRTDNASGVSEYRSGPTKLTHLNHKHENTFRMDHDLRFSSCEIERITESVLIERLKDEQYDPSCCKELSQEMAAKIMDRIKELKIKRYKVVALVSIGSVNERPGMQFGSRCLWNENTDSFASVKFTNGSLFAVAMVYGLYFE